MELKWLNRPAYAYHPTWGGGLGFATLSETPFWRGKLRKNRKAPEIFPASDAALLVSSRVVNLLVDFGADQLEICDTRWTEDTDAELRDYKLLDVRINLQSYDYDQCEVIISKSEGRMFGSLGRQRGFRDDIDAGIHFFHDLYYREPFILSRQLAHHLRDAGIRGLVVRDPALYGVSFKLETIARGEL